MCMMQTRVLWLFPFLSFFQFFLWILSWVKQFCTLTYLLHCLRFPVQWWTILFWVLSVGFFIYCIAVYQETSQQKGSMSSFFLFHIYYYSVSISLLFWTLHLPSLGEVSAVRLNGDIRASTEVKHPGNGKLYFLLTVRRCASFSFR